jgi:hypothetical protein
MTFKALFMLVAIAVLSIPRATLADTPLPTFSDLVLRTPLGPDVREIDVPGLPDTAMAEMTAEGPVILYNPELFRAAGPAREFVRAHEAGHVILAHLEDPWMTSTDEGRARAEAQADCFAARRASHLAVVAMVRLLRRRAPEASDAIYGTKQQRAKRILACAGITEG